MKAIIAEDEDIIRDGFYSLIPWKELGFSCVTTFSDGAPAIDFLRDNHVDFILTDIKMHSVSGLEIAKYVFENKLKTHICIVSGLKDFDNALEAIKYDVDDFITKPTNFKEATNIIKGIVQVIENERISLLNEQKYSQIKYTMITQFFSDILFNNMPEKDILLKQAQELELLNHDLFICPVWIFIEDMQTYLKEKWKYGKDSFWIAICNFIFKSEMFTMHKISIYNNEIMLLAITDNIDNQLSFQHNIKKHMDDVSKRVKQYFNININISFGKTFSAITDFLDFISYPDYSFNLFDNESVSKSTTNIFLIEMYKNIVFFILSNRAKDAIDSYNNVFNIWKLSSGDYLNKKSEDFLRFILKHTSKIIDKINTTDATNKLQELHCLTKEDEILTFSYKWLNDLCLYVQCDGIENAQEAIVASAKKFIEENYYSDISLEDISNFVFLSSAYLSKIFKKLTGKTFKEYLISLRISKSIELLREGKYKVREISEKVGYNDSKYFSKQFKNIVGCTPKEFVDSLVK